MDKTQKYYDILEREFMLYSPKIGLAILVFVIGNWVTNYITKLIMKAMVSRGFDISLQSFLGSMVGVSLKIVLLITVAGVLGLQTTSLVAVIGAAGLAVGLALQGSLANFAGGVLTLVFKPYVVGDIIDSLGVNGEVKEIQIFNTILLTPDGKTVILPNGAVSNSTIINYSKHHALRTDIKFTVNDSTDFEKLKTALLEVCAASKWTLKNTNTTVIINKVFDGTEISVRPHVAPLTYWDALADLNEDVRNCVLKFGVVGHMPELIHYNEVRK